MSILNSEGELYPIIWGEKNTDRIIIKANSDPNPSTSQILQKMLELYKQPYNVGVLPLKDELNMLQAKLKLISPSSKFEIDVHRLLRGLSAYYLEDFSEAKMHLKTKFSHFNNMDIESVRTTILDIINHAKPTKKEFDASFLFSRKFDQETDGIQHHYVKNNIDFFKSEAFTGSRSFDSQDFGKVDKYLNQVKLDDMLFIIAHGDSQKGSIFNENYSGSKRTAIYANELESIAGSNKLIALLNCSVQPYYRLKDHFKYLITPESYQEGDYTEMFIHGFLLGLSKTQDIDLSIKSGLVALLMKSNQKLVYSVFKDGKEFIW